MESLARASGQYPWPFGWATVSVSEKQFWKILQGCPNAFWTILTAFWTINLHYFLLAFQ